MEQKNVLKVLSPENAFIHNSNITGARIVKYKNRNRVLVSDGVSGMLKYTIARQMSGKRVFTNRGEELGKLLDLIIDEKSGVIESLLVEVRPDSRAARRAGLTEKIVQIPYAAVTAVSDVVIVDESHIRPEE